MSNPIMNADRKSLYSMVAEQGFAMRQDLRALQVLASTSERTYFSHLPKPDKDRFKTVLDDVVKVSSDGKLDTSCLEVVQEGCPISNLQHKGAQIHPPLTKQEGKYVSVKRQFGGTGPKDLILTQALSTAYEPDYLIEKSREVVYSKGTISGFNKRLKELTTRKCVGEGAPTQISAKLKRLLPLVKELPDWHDIPELFERLETTQSAGAGLPYCTNKGAAAAAMLDSVLPIVVEALEKGDLGSLYREHPELFLCEVKNKEDRYDTPKLEDKTRPYVSQPFHFSALFSSIMQPFCGALQTWDNGDLTYNAYGWSMANGGIRKVYDRVNAMYTKSKHDKKVRVKVGLYGDDAKIFLVTSQGVQSVDPDFRQMDGSVDYQTVQGVARWIYDSYAAQHGESPFWKNVLKVWIDFSTNPNFVLEGKTVYRKKNSDGILSGVVGTTLLDTAKSALAYSDLLDSVMTDLSLFKDEKKVVKFMKDKHGLVIKDGTWNPETLDMRPRHAELWTNNKFLGMRFMWYGDDSLYDYTLVPMLTTEEWVSMILHPRNTTQRTKLSDLAKNRMSFDRARGYLITGAAFDPVINDILRKAIDLTPATAILMAVASGGGKGEAPGEHQIVGEDFMWPTSEGVPSVSWCAQLYAGMDEKTGWESVFPNIADELRTTRTTWKQRLRNRVVVKRVDDTATVIQHTYKNPQPIIVEAQTSFATTLVEPVRVTLKKPVPAPRTSLQKVPEYVSALVEQKGLYTKQELESTIGRKLPQFLDEVVVQPENASVIVSGCVKPDALMNTPRFPLTKTGPGLHWLNIWGQLQNLKPAVVTTVTDPKTEEKKIDVYLGHYHVGTITGVKAAKILRDLLMKRIYYYAKLLVDNNFAEWKRVGTAHKDAQPFSVEIKVSPQEEELWDARLLQTTLAQGSGWVAAEEVADRAKLDLERIEIMTHIEQAKKVLEELQTTLKQHTMQYELKYGKKTTTKKANAPPAKSRGGGPNQK